ncbi:MAG: DUF2066 domain-containing protein [Beijerinckiaceae bacterium]|nr:DUF2066 domain-containing protein [Beijerinckiaceae bacterium]
MRVSSEALGQVIRTVILLVIVTACPTPIVADDLYVVRAVTTGTAEERRLPALGPAFLDELAKVSGDAALRGRPAAIAFSKHAAEFVASFSYHDRIWYRPVHDEQGTRDRPHDLILHFDRAKIDAALASLGAKPWIGERPTLVVFLRADLNGYRSVIDSESERFRPQREAWLNASAKTGLPVLLPGPAVLDKNKLDYEALGDSSFDLLNKIALSNFGEIALRGDMRFDPESLGWVSRWEIERDGKIRCWGSRGLGFDRAYLEALSDAAMLLSGNGEPPSPDGICTDRTK